MSEDNFVDVGNEAQWKPEANGDHVIGYFMETRADVGKFSSNVHILQKKDGTRIAVWGSKVLDERIAQNVSPGVLVKITYTGKETARDGKNSYHTFNLGIDPSQTITTMPVNRTGVSESDLDNTSKRDETGSASSQNASMIAGAALGAAAAAANMVEDDLPF